MPALNDEELAYVHEIVALPDYTVRDVADLAALLTDAQRDLIRADIVLWTAARGGADVTIDGGRDGVKIIPEEDRKVIRARTLGRLGIVGVGSKGLFTIPIGGR